jgi:hypothetical protein
MILFARVKQSRNGEYLQVVENYREDGKVRQRMVLYVGRYDGVADALELMPRDVRVFARSGHEDGEGGPPSRGRRPGRTPRGPARLGRGAPRTTRPRPLGREVGQAKARNLVRWSPRLIIRRGRAASLRGPDEAGQGRGRATFPNSRRETV